MLDLRRLMIQVLALNHDLRIKLTQIFHVLRQITDKSLRVGEHRKKLQNRRVTLQTQTSSDPAPG